MKAYWNSTSSLLEKLQEKRNLQYEVLENVKNVTAHLARPQTTLIVHITTAPKMHKITILNTRNGETFNYPLIKLFGNVTDNGNCKNENRLYISDSKQKKRYEAEVIGNFFKILIELDPGDNEFKVEFCCETACFNWEYKAIDTDLTLLPLYIICRGDDGSFQAPEEEDNSVESACKRIDIGAKLLQCLAAEKLKEHNFEKKSFTIEGTCKVFKSSLEVNEAKRMSQEELWSYFGREIMNSDLGSPQRKYLAFLSFTRYIGDKYEEGFNHEQLISITEGYAALGGGGLALFGTACLYTWPESVQEISKRFRDQRLVDRTKFLDDSCYRNTLGGCFSTTLGSTLHELFHTFDLGHTKQGIMGRGFDNIFKAFEMPKEDKLKPHLSKIEFKEEFEAQLLSERLQNENKPKDFNVIEKYDETDDTALSKHCAVFLNFHKWFNTFEKKAATLAFDPSNRLIKSTVGIRVVEIRETSSEMVLHSWTFEGKILKFSFHLPDEVFEETGGNKVLLVVEDSLGEILKELII